MTIEHEEVTEPCIVAAGISEDDVFVWMDKKVNAIRCLKSALADRDCLMQALEEIDARISRLTKAAALNFNDKTQCARQRGKEIAEILDLKRIERAKTD